MEALSSHRLSALVGRITLTLVLLALIASLWGWGQGSEEPGGKLRLRFVDSETGQVTPVRVEVLDQEDQAFVAEDVLLAGGDPVDQAVRWEGTVEEALARLKPSWRNFDKGTTQFYSGGESLLQLPSGQYRVTASKGIEYREVSREVAVAAGSDSELTLEIPRWINLPEKGWYSADPHIHVARTHKELDPLISKWMQAEDVHVATLLQWGNVTGFHNAPQYDFGPDSVYREGIYLLASGQENPRTHVFGPHHHSGSLGACQFSRPVPHLSTFLGRGAPSGGAQRVCPHGNPGRSPERPQHRLAAQPDQLSGGSSVQRGRLQRVVQHPQHRVQNEARRRARIIPLGERPLAASVSTPALRGLSLTGNGWTALSRAAPL